MTDTKPSATPSVTIAQIVAALQSLGVDVPLANEETQTQKPPVVAPTVSARISSPWAPTPVIPIPAGPPTTPSPEVTRSEAPVNTTVIPQSTSATPGEGGYGFVCQHCHQYNILKSPSDTWYTVTAGRSVGVFQGWHKVQPLVSGVSHATFRKYVSEAAAIAAFEDARSAGVVIILN